MKPFTIILTLFTLHAMSLRLLGESPFLHEWSALQAQHDKALAAATEPINRTYKAGVEALLRRATQANDLEAAQALRAELDKLGGDVPLTEAQGTTAELLTSRLVNTKWVYFGGETLTLLAGGKAQWSTGNQIWPWKITSAGRRVIEGVNMAKGTKFTITFDHDLKTGTIDGDGGTRKTRNITGQ